ncbi:MAG: nucleotide pyrophosphatase, partial [Leptolyngbyaceae cyanobacterium SL_7_1]|nr:nucleotide pyrophosphatase [Leptolyngbyaceae cyanobacterium SL_7_1]
MRNPVIGIGLEGCDPVLLEQWMAQGHLQNLAKVRQQGVYGQLVNSVDYNGVSADFFATEPSWGMVLTGCFPSKTGFWDVVKFNPDNYTIVCDKIYTDPAYPPFYALNQHHQVITFDVPVTRLSDKLNGMQIQGWGGHFPTPPSCSLPTNLLSEIISKHGEDPLKYKDDGKWWNQQYIDWVQGAIEQSATKRVKICQDLLKHPYDLFLTVFGDIHAAGHDLYDQSQPDHLLYNVRHNNGKAIDPLLEAYKAIDRAVGDLLATIPEHAYVLFFSVHGMAANHTDVLSMFTLSEFLYRFSFPGKVGFAGNKSRKVPAAITKPIRKGWSGEIWRTLKNANPMQRLIN